jgi:hypothetical protein
MMNLIGMKSQSPGGITRRNIFNMIRFAEVFRDRKIVYALRAQLGWTHFTLLLPLRGNFTDTQNTVSQVLPNARKSKAVWAADLEVGDTAGLEACATGFHPFAGYGYEISRLTD